MVQERRYNANDSQRTSRRIAKTKSEVAEEIFEEIYDILGKHKIDSFNNTYDDAMTAEIAKLKKKYMEVD